jgi:hypothetical protein
MMAGGELMQVQVLVTVLLSDLADGADATDEIIGFIANSFTDSDWPFVFESVTVEEVKA